MHQPQNPIPVTYQVTHLEAMERYPELVRVWRSAVDATHDFVDDADLARIEQKLITDYFPQVRLNVIEIDGQIRAFSGVYADSLEMLFVDAVVFGQGLGRALLQHALGELGVQRVDVNEQNTAATQFYLSHGFEVCGRSEHDSDGLPYPVLHLVQSAK